jgi:hypothetical protein
MKTTGDDDMNIIEPEPANFDDDRPGPGVFICLAVIVAVIIFVGKCFFYLSGMKQ